MNVEQYEAYKNSVKVIAESSLMNGKGQPFIKLLQAITPNGSKYVYSQRAGVNSIKFILVDNNHKLFGLVQEIKPPIMGSIGALNYNSSAFGGSLPLEVKRVQDSLELVSNNSDGDASSLIVQVEKEVRQETGFQVTAPRISQHFTKLLGSQSDEVVHGFIVDVTNLKPLDRKLETGEEMSSVVWMKFEDVMIHGCLSAIVLATFHNKK